MDDGDERAKVEDEGDEVKRARTVEDDGDEVKRVRTAEEEPSPQLVEYVEREIWAKAESNRAFPTTSGFAQQCVDLGLCATTSEAKKLIRACLLESSFSASRVIQHVLQEQEDSSPLHRLQHVRTAQGDESVVFADMRVVFEAVCGESSSASSALLRDRFSSVNVMELATKTHNFDCTGSAAAKQSLLTFSNVKRALTLLKGDNSSSNSVLPPSRKKLEKQLHAVCPLQYTVFTNRNVFQVRKAQADCAELAKLALAHEFINSTNQQQQQHSCLPTSSSNVFLLHDNHQRRRRLLTTTSSPQLALAVFPTLYAAAAALRLGHPLPAPHTHQITLRTGGVGGGGVAWIVYKVHDAAVEEEGGGAALVVPVECAAEIECFAQCQFSSRSSVLTVRESRALVPVAIGFA